MPWCVRIFPFGKIWENNGDDLGSLGKKGLSFKPLTHGQLSR